MMRMIRLCPALLLGIFILAASGFYNLSFAQQNAPDLFKPSKLQLQQINKLFEVKAQWLASRKYDGVRAYWNGKQLLSRAGNSIAAPDNFIKQLPPFELDGELWIETGRFSQINALLQSETGTQNWRKGWRQVHYLIFEVPNQKGGLLERLSVLSNFLDHHSSSQLKRIKQIPVVNKPELLSIYQKIVDLGGEGIIVRDGNEPYRTGRVASILKLKPYEDAECIVQGFEAGKGRFTGMVGSIECALLNRQKARLFPSLNRDEKVRIRLGTGLSYAQRKNPPAIGSMLTFRYSGLTASGLPRFAVFMRQRKTAQEVQVQNLNWDQ